MAFNTEGSRTLATTSLEPHQLDDKYHFHLRKLHSLCGIVPVGVFLCEHMLTNSMAWYGGAKEFNESVHFLHGLPFLPALEFFGVFLPLAFHAIYGIVIALGMHSNVGAYKYATNWRYFFQRLTGYIAFVFIIIHLFKYRFAHWVGWGPEFIGSEDPFEITRHGLMAWSPGGHAVMPPVVTLIMYWIGLAAACFHFGNGIWNLCITWGISITPKAQKHVGVVAALVGIILFIGGSLGLIAFANAPEPGKPAQGHVVVDGSALHG